MAGVLRGTPAPPSDITEEDEFFFKAFWQLTTCRNVGMGEGPIPWSAIVQWAEINSLDEDTFQEVQEVIPALDRIYMKYRADEAKKPAK
jgi:hypothetical protein